MCGGYSLIKNLQKIAGRFETAETGFDFHPRYNVRPGQNMPVVLNTAPRKLTVAHWGITPFSKKTSGQIINTRIESVDKPVFKKDFLSRRCLIPADGFFEWEKTASGSQPYYFTIKNHGLFALAGIWEEDTDGKPHFTILTIKPNPLVAKIHDRMPVILPPDMEKEWLFPENEIHTLLDKIKPYPAGEMAATPVSKKVNLAQNDYPDLIKPLATNL